jgi:CRISPR-associated protein Csb1
MNPSSELTLDVLCRAVAGEGVAIRAVTRLEPAGGPGDKIFPPTYVKDGKSQTKYAMEERIVDGRRVQVVLLDSVASQANRIEEALLEGWRRNELLFPVVSVDFSDQEGLEDLDEITALQTPHRIADALLRDSIDSSGTPFRNTAAGKECLNSRPNSATGMYRHCPTALVFGVWDSTGPKGGLGAKFQRSLVSEIVGHDAIPGVKTASRIDPAAIEKKAGPIFEAKDGQGDWTSIEADAAREKNKPKLFSRKGAGEAGTPASINHGNIPPSIDTEAGGVTISHAVHTVVLSLAGLRRLRFRQTVDGKTIPSATRDAAETAARTALAALALAGVVYQRKSGYDLRSRSLLVTKEPLCLEIVRHEGDNPALYTIEDPAGLLREAIGAAEKHGLGWQAKPMKLKPTPKLVHLIRESRKLTAAGGEEGKEAA